jgi:transposase
MRWIGLDVHHRYIHASEINEASQIKHYRISMSEAGIADLKQRLGPDASVVMEASTQSACLHDELLGHASKVSVAHPSQTRGASALHVKTDLRDSEALARLLQTGFIRAVWVPSEKHRGLRSVVEYRYSIRVLHAAMINRAKALVREQLMEYPRGISSGRSMSVLTTLPWKNASLQIAASSIARIAKFLDEELMGIDTELATWAASEPRAKLLQTIPGVGTVTAAVLISDIGDVSRFETPDKLCSYVGLVPRVHASGKTLRIGHLSGVGRKQTRCVLWLAVGHVIRSDGRFQKAFAELCRRRPKRVARIACIRRLLTVIWHMLSKSSEFLRQPLPEDKA